MIHDDELGIGEQARGEVMADTVMEIGNLTLFSIHLHYYNFNYICPSRMSTTHVSKILLALSSRSFLPTAAKCASISDWAQYASLGVVGTRITGILPFGFLAAAEWDAH